jgi:hypothetical protein
LPQEDSYHSATDKTVGAFDLPVLGKQSNSQRVRILKYWLVCDINLVLYGSLFILFMLITLSRLISPHSIILFSN